LKFLKKLSWYLGKKTMGALNWIKQRIKNWTMSTDMEEYNMEND
jgi:hypothetical protein